VIWLGAVIHKKQDLTHLKLPNKQLLQYLAIM
jgi:hypothetical protein